MNTSFSTWFFVSKHFFRDCVKILAIGFFAALCLPLSAAEMPGVTLFEVETDEPQVAALVYGETEQALTECGKFRVIDRSRRNAVLQEQMTALDDFTRPSAMFRFGQLLDADYILFSTVIRKGPTLYIYLKLTDVTTGETLYPQSVTAADDPAAVKAGISAAVAIIADHFETRGQVLRTDAASFTTDLGHRNNVRPGDVLAVYRQGEVMVDPLTYQVVGFDRRKVGQARVTEVLDAELARAELIAGGDVQSGDLVVPERRTAQSAPTPPPAVSLAPSPLNVSHIRLTTEPVEASVYLNNNFVGRTSAEAPMTLLVPAGRHVLRIEKGSYLPVRRLVQTEPGDDVQTIVRLTPQEGYLYLTSTPPTCEVYLDGQYEGLTPVRVARRQTGSGRLLLHRAGYRDYGKKVTVTLGAVDDLDLTLREQRGAEPTFEPPGMVYVPGGQFTMGCDAGPEDERPAHVVTLDGFFVDRHEVMVKEYRQFCELTGRTMPQLPVWVEDNHPMTNVSWADATAYAAWSGKRLPTEAEWEYLARNLGRLTQPPQKQAANIQGVNGADRWPRTAPVGSFAPDALGLCDLAGNVFEWCSDWYDRRSYSRSVARNPGGADFGSRRVIRGGCWAFGAEALDPFRRAFASPATRSDIIGFRCVTDAR